MVISWQATSVLFLKNVTHLLQVRPMPDSAPTHLDTSFKWKIGSKKSALNSQIFFLWTKTEMSVPRGIYPAGPFTMVFALWLLKVPEALSLISHYKKIPPLLSCFIFNVFSEHSKDRKLVPFYWPLLPWNLQ